MRPPGQRHPSYRFADKKKAITLQVGGSDSRGVPVKVMDVQDRTMKMMTVTPNQTAVFGSDFRAGVYLVEVKQGGEVKTLRVVKY